MVTYRPIASQGRLWLGGLGFGILALGLWSIFLTASLGSIGLVFSGALPIVLSLIFLLPFLWLPSLRYELEDERLTMRCGPLRYVIDLSEIERVTRRDLTMSMWSSFRLPGVALGEAVYGDVGNVVMCATRALKGITLIETRRRKYGLTPADEKALLADLEARLAKLRGRRAFGPGA